MTHPHSGANAKALPNTVQRLQSVITKVEDASKRSPYRQAVKLLAVSKTWTIDHIQPVIDAGHRCFAENKLQEAQEKIPTLNQEGNLKWHFIGRLQKNKVRKIIRLFDCIHSFDSLKLLQYADTVAIEEGRSPQALLQINLAGEAQKGGFSPQTLIEALPLIKQLQSLQIIGLMIIPPAVNEPEASRPWFKQLHNLKDELNHQYDLNWNELSMGMSHDYPMAIEEGATMVRVGSAIFGQRHSPN